MEKKWVIIPEPNRDTIIRLIEDLGVSRPLANLLAQRKIETFDQARTFFRPSLADLHNPFEMKGMNEAVNRIQEAIANHENILIYGDYDVDGTTSVALMYQYLTRFYEQVGYYIPNRYDEGYGISLKGVNFAIDNSFSLVIALDCGTKAIDQIHYANENGVDFIVCDHHLPGEELPNAILLNPKQPECTYPFKELSGCGIGFKLVQAHNEANGGHLDEIEDLLDLVVVSIGADLVSMTGENRILAHVGLTRLSSQPRIGLKRLLKLANNGAKNLTISDIVFSIAPRINAAGRIESGNQAVELLLAQTEDEVLDISKQIHGHNETRKGIDKQTTKEALAVIEKDDWLLNATTTVVYNENWHKGVIGIVASRLIETYYRPTIVLTQSKGVAVGSCRSIDGFNIYDALVECTDLLTQFGGHYFAAGLSMPVENIPAFKLRFNALASSQLTKKQLVPKLDIDVEIDFRDIFESQLGGIPKFYRILKQLAPFGPDNPSPVFVSRFVEDTGYSRVLKDEHVKLSLKQELYPEIIVEAIAFNFANVFKQIQKEPFDIVYTIEENHWQGRSSLQLMIKDIRFIGQT